MSVIMHFAVVWLVTLASPCQGIAFSWEDCGVGKAHAKIENITISPAVPKVGDKITITSRVVLNKNTSEIKCDLAMASKYHRQVDICKGGVVYAPLKISTVDFPASHCPKQAGVLHGVRYVTFNKHPPRKANPTTILTCHDQDGELFSCSKTTFVQDKHGEMDEPPSDDVMV